MRKKILLIVALLHIAATGIWAAKIDLSKLANYTNYEAKNGEIKVRKAKRGNASDVFGMEDEA